MDLQRKKLNKKTLILIGIGAFAGILLLIYLGMGFYYKTHYLPNTEVSGVSISGLSCEKANDKLADVVDNYNLIIYDRDGNSYNLNGTDFGFTFSQDVLEDSLKTLINNQNSFSWPVALFHNSSSDLDFSNCYDTDKLKTAILNLDCFNSDSVTTPENATIAYSKDDSQFEITSEVTGNQLIEDTAVSQITTAVSQLATEVTLTDEDYESPTVYSDDDVLETCLDQANAYLTSTVTYDIADNDEVVDASTIASWITINDDYSISLDDDAITKYVQALASKYNTYADVRDFKTSSGDTIQIGGGDYGWVIDKDAEKEQLIADISSGSAVEREPVYSQTAADRGSNDIGNTYIEIDYTKQHLWYYQDGSLKFDTDIVSGNINKGNGSPDGIFKIIYKKSPATLVGEDYQSDVQYFMVFAYNVGIHDASWRSQFGGEIYKTSGSHGCINIAASAAETLYSMLETDTPVVAYYREAVQLTAENAEISNAYSYVSDDANTTE